MSCFPLCSTTPTPILSLYFSAANWMLMAVGAPTRSQSKNVRFSAFRSWSRTFMKVTQMGIKGYRCWQMPLLDARIGKQLSLRAAALYVRMRKWVWLCARRCVYVQARANVFLKQWLVLSLFEVGLLLPAGPSFGTGLGCHSEPGLMRTDGLSPRLVWCLLFSSSLSPTPSLVCEQSPESMFPSYTVRLTCSSVKMQTGARDDDY